MSLDHAELVDWLITHRELNSEIQTPTFTVSYLMDDNCTVYTKITTHLSSRYFVYFVRMYESQYLWALRAPYMGRCV